MTVLIPTSGPGLNQRGMSVELTVRGLGHDGRIRVLLGYLAGAFEDVVETESGRELSIARSLTLTDIVVNRERLSARPLEFVTNGGVKTFDKDMWLPEKGQSSPFYAPGRAFAGAKRQVNPRGDTVTTAITNELLLPLGWEDRYRCELPGGILIEAPRSISLEPVEEGAPMELRAVELRVLWAGQQVGRSPVEGITGGSISFLVQPDTVVMETESRRMMLGPQVPPPLLLSFDAEEYVPI